MLRLDRETGSRLAHLADEEIAAALRGLRDTPPAQDRREALGMTVSTALPRAAEAWRPVLSPLGVRARLVGAFSFGAPQVEFVDDAGALRTCGVADLLVVVDDLRAGRPARQALLVRTLEAAGCGAAADGVAQLYQGWPSFRFRAPAHADRPRALSAARRRGRPETGCCAIIDPRDRSGWTINRASAMARGRPVSLGRLIVQVARGRAGRPARRGGLDDWSATVDELLNRTVRAALTGAAGPTQRLRATTTFAGPSGTGHVVFENAMGLDDDEAAARGGLEGPVSVVHLCLDAPEPPKPDAGRRG